METAKIPHNWIGLRKFGIYMPHMEFYSAIKKNEIFPFQVNGWNWGTLSSVKLAKFRSQSHMFSLISGTYKYYEKQIMLRGGHIQERKSKEKKLRR
jgi:hypothetical protein